MSADIPHLPSYVRTSPERMRLEGNQCEICGTKHFPPKAVCPSCAAEIQKGYEVGADFFGFGIVKAILSKKKNEEREIHISAEEENKSFVLSVNLNGLSHSAKLELGMKIPVFVKAGEYLVNLASLFSK